MKRTKGFTLTELLVVVTITALLVIVLVLIIKVRWGSRELGHPPICAKNLHRIGMGFLIYMAENDDSPPWIASDDWSSATGTNAMSTSTPTTVNPTALMFMLVRSGQPVGLFRCPNDKNATEMATTKYYSGGVSYYYWDFYDTEKESPTAADNCRKVSYSIQAPLYDTASASYSAGFTANSRGGLAIVADKTPDFDGKTPCTDWSANLSKTQRKAGMSQNHNSGDFINVLYADGHVSGSNRADVGIGNDNIYSASNNSKAGTQGAGSLTLTQHLSEDDSFLIGPVK